MAGHGSLWQGPARNPHATAQTVSKSYRRSQTVPLSLNLDDEWDIEIDFAGPVTDQPDFVRRSCKRVLRRRSRVLRCAMIVLVWAVLIAAFAVFQHRKESNLQMRWVPDAETRLFEQRPLLPPPEHIRISNYTLPLRTKGRHIVDAESRRFKLASINWYGASDEFYVPGGLEVVHRKEIAESIKRLGFNSVRLPYSDEMVTKNPVSKDVHLLANPDLMGLRALDVFEAVTTTLTDAGLAVIVNDHITSATWCCGANPCDAAWTNSYLGPLCKVSMSEEQWIRNWENVMSRFVANPLVIGADLRNEVRGLWGTMPWSSWAAAAERCGNRLLSLNPDWLIVVEGTSSANDLSGAGTRPVKLSKTNKLVYSAHVYGWSGWGSWAGRFKQQTYGSFREAMRQNWGYLLEGDIAPVWVGEFGAPRHPTKGDANYWQLLWRYMKAVDADFGYWAINTRKPSGSVETYSIVEPDWKTAIRDYRLKDMIEHMRA